MSERANMCNLEEECDLDLIEENLYLGNKAAALNLKILNENKIKSILTVDVVQLPESIQDMPEMTTKFIKIIDVPDEDLYIYFGETYDFIETRKKKGAVLVHCHYGASRSATVVIAFIMRSHQDSFEDAYNLVKSKHSVTCPNPGFIKQLKLYYELNYQVDKSHQNYRMLRLTLLTESFHLNHWISESFRKLIKPDPYHIEDTLENRGYKCRTCNRILAFESNSFTHTVKGKVCQLTYFFEPIAWMEEITSKSDGDLFCPKCKKIIGGFSWSLGYNCKCGYELIPSFYVFPGKVAPCEINDILSREFDGTVDRQRRNAQMSIFK